MMSRRFQVSGHVVGVVAEPARSTDEQRVGVSGSSGLAARLATQMVAGQSQLRKDVRVPAGRRSSTQELELDQDEEKQVNGLSFAAFERLLASPVDASPFDRALAMCVRRVKKLGRTIGSEDRRLLAVEVLTDKKLAPHLERPFVAARLANWELLPDRLEHLVFVVAARHHEPFVPYEKFGFDADALYWKQRRQRAEDAVNGTSAVPRSRRRRQALRRRCEAVEGRECPGSRGDGKATTRRLMEAVAHYGRQPADRRVDLALAGQAPDWVDELANHLDVDLDTARSDWLQARCQLAEQGRLSYLTLLAQAIEQGDPRRIAKERKRVRRVEIRLNLN